MKTRISRAALYTIWYMATGLGFLVGAIIFIPFFIWGVCNRLTPTEVFVAYWSAFIAEISRQYDELKDS